MPRRSASSPSSRHLRLEFLESRNLLTAVPFGPEIVIDTNEASDILIDFADIDGDGDLDMVGGDDGLFWYENTDGAGTFGAPQTIATAGQANNVRDIDVGDIDRDGDLDVVASSASDDTVQWWANDGAGGFGAAQNVVTGDSVGSSVALVDYDHDGDLDILTNGDTVDWYANNGSGTFTAQSNFTFNMNFLDAADFDRDGSVDIVAADLVNDSLTLLTASGSASVAINNPGNLIAVDLDGDGDQDVVATSEGDGSLVWYENDGSAGSFFSGNPSPQTIDGALSGAFDVRAGDFDKDGDLDLLASGTAGDTVVWYENDGSATPSFTRHTLTTTATGAENVAIADIDGDGDLDVSYVSSSDNRRVWRENLAIHSAHTIDTQAEVTIDNGASFRGGFESWRPRFTWWENHWRRNRLSTGMATQMFSDVDGDGECPWSNDGDITWWENAAGDGSVWT